MTANKIKPIAKRAKKTLNLALQGGGAHAAFTWGVLDRLLEENQLSIEAISGTSAGAIQAVLLSLGLATGNRTNARQLLEKFWKKVSSSAKSTALQPSLLDKALNNYNLDFSPNFIANELATQLFSPYQLNLLNINPLEEILEEIIDFKKLKTHGKIKLFINATNVKTGKIKIFSNDNLTIKSLLASACLPHLYKAVEIDGEHYWDGGYTGNPAIFPLTKVNSKDVMIVQVSAFNIDDVPTLSQNIKHRINEIIFNETLSRELKSILHMQKLLNGSALPAETANFRFHLITASDILSSISFVSKMNTDWNFLIHLRDIGRQSADDWLNIHYDKIGIKSSTEIEKLLND
jgi:NTE family protein